MLSGRVLVGRTDPRVSSDHVAFRGEAHPTTRCRPSGFALAIGHRYAFSNDNLTTDIVVYSTRWTDVPQPSIGPNDQTIRQSRPCSGNISNGMGGSSSNIGFCERNLWVSTDADLIGLDPLILPHVRSLQSVLQHETGHSVGLGHGLVSPSTGVMADTIPFGTALNVIHDDECEGVVYIMRDTAQPSGPTLNVCP